MHKAYRRNARAIIAPGDCLPTLRALPEALAKLIVTSPPYNMGKVYETPRDPAKYFQSVLPIACELVRLMAPTGSLCWQVGNYVAKGELYPLDIFYYDMFKKLGLKLRNRIVWYFAHGLHAKTRLSGRYEVILWFTKGDDYTFNLDNVRTPAKYPGKRHYKGAKQGQPSGNPLGKNPSDVWPVVAQDWENGIWDIPNVKANHPEKTEHPCQYPI